jgi:hypothetical protein
MLPDDLPDNGGFTWNDITLRAATTRSDGEYLHLVLWWEVLAQLPTNYGMDIRLLDANGYEWARRNALMGGAGMYPAVLWREGEIIPDGYRVGLPPYLPPGQYTLRLNIYNPVTLDSFIIEDVENVPQPYAAPYACPLPNSSEYHDGLRIVELRPTVTDTALIVDMEWIATYTPAENYQLRWTLGDKEWITPLAPGSDARDWQTDASNCGVRVRAVHQLPLDEIPPGTYDATLQLLSSEGEPLVDVYTFTQVTR